MEHFLLPRRSSPPLDVLTEARVSNPSAAFSSREAELFRLGESSLSRVLVSTQTGLARRYFFSIPVFDRRRFPSVNCGMLFFLTTTKGSSDRTVSPS